MFPEVRILPAGHTLLGPVDGVWTVRGDVVAEFVSPGSVASDRFSDVTLIVYDPDGVELAREEIGDFDADDAAETDDDCTGDLLTRSFEVVPGAFPYRLALTAEEVDLHCDDREFTVLDAVFNDYYDVGHSGRLHQYWSHESHPCPDE